MFSVKAKVTRLAEELRTDLIGQIPLGQPIEAKKTSLHLFMPTTTQLEKFIPKLQLTYWIKPKNNKAREATGLPPPVFICGFPSFLPCPPFPSTDFPSFFY